MQATFQQDTGGTHAAHSDLQTQPDKAAIGEVSHNRYGYRIWQTCLFSLFHNNEAQSNPPVIIRETPDCWGQQKSAFHKESVRVWKPVYLERVEGALSDQRAQQKTDIGERITTDSLNFLQLNL